MFWIRNKHRPNYKHPLCPSFISRNLQPTTPFYLLTGLFFIQLIMSLSYTLYSPPLFFFFSKVRTLLHKYGGWF